MSRTLSAMATAVLRNVESPEDSSTTQYLADVKAYINERARTIWRVPLFPEYLIFGTFRVPAGTKIINNSDIIVDSGYNTSASTYNASFDKIIAVREGSNPLMPEDSGAIQKLQADLWASTTNPSLFVPRGNKGIVLLGQYSVATTLSFFGKAKFQSLTDAETWIMDDDGDALVAGATAEALRKHERDEGRAQIQEAIFTGELNRLIHERKVQGADVTRVIPLNPWTKDFSVDQDISRIGMDSNY